MKDFQFPNINLAATGAKIRQHRMANKMTVHQLATILRVSDQAVKKWQRGDCLPTIDNVVALSVLFHISIESLICTDEAFPFVEVTYSDLDECNNYVLN